MMLTELEAELYIAEKEMLAVVTNQTPEPSVDGLSVASLVPQHGPNQWGMPALTG